jgi:Tol biopolymer transport system component
MLRRTLMVVALSASFVLVASAAYAQSISWVSVSADGSGGRLPIAMSDDGRFVAFGSDTANLVPNDTNGVTDVFVRDMQTGTVQRVSVSSSSVEANGSSGFDTVDISADGRYVLFDSASSNLVAGLGAAGPTRLYVHDRQTGTTDVIRFDDGSLPLGPGSPAGWGSMSADGRYVSFAGSSGYGGANGVYVADLVDGSVERLTDGTNFASHTVESTAISDDGRFVAFETRFFNSNEDLIWFDRDNPSDWKVANPRLNDEDPQHRLQGWQSISGDGRYVSFSSPSDNLVAGDTAGTLDVFVFDSQTEALERIPAEGFWNAASFWPNPVLSADGRYVAFSAGNPAWTTGQYDIVFYDRNTSTAQSVTPFDTLAAPGSAWAFNPAMTRDARFVAFNTQSSFAAGDSGGFDVYLVDRQGGDGLPDGSEPVGLVDPAQGFWTLYNLNGSVYKSFFFGNPGDFPIFGDWNCNGISTPGMYRQSDGFVYLRNSNTQGIGDIRFFFGNPGDIPIVGDFNGDGCDTVSIYRPSEGRVFIINELGANEGGLGAAEFSYFFGNPGDKPFVGDFNGNGIDTVGLHRESTGFVYFRQSHTQGIADAEFFFGDPADRLVAGDWGFIDGVDTPAIFRPSDATFYFRYTNTQGNADATLTVGESPWLPVAGWFFE